MKMSEKEKLQVIGGDRCSEHLIPVPQSSAPTDQAVSLVLKKQSQHTTTTLAADSFCVFDLQKRKPAPFFFYFFSQQHS